MTVSKKENYCLIKDSKKITDMKKIMYLLSSLLLTTSTILTGCSKDDNDKNDDVVDFAQRIDTYTIEPTFIYGSYLLHPNNRNHYEDSWSSTGTTFDVFVLQGGVFNSIGKLHSKETSIASADKKKAVHLEVPIPAGINTNMSYQVVAIHAPGSVAFSNGNIVYTLEEERGDLYCGSWYVMQGGKSNDCRANYLTTIEGLRITNNTDAAIKVKHKGYDTTEKWYYSKGMVNITPLLSIETSGQTSQNEAISPEVEIKAGEHIWIDSRYVANGRKMTDASLILEIDGKEVRTTPASSNVTIENGIPCFLEVIWDGKTLAWD
jgi:hypothetical protein